MPNQIEERNEIINDTDHFDFIQTDHNNLFPTSQLRKKLQTFNLNNESAFKPSINSEWGFFHYGNNDELMAGISGRLFFGCIHIDLLWISEKLRKKGIGKQLLQLAEKHGKSQNCLFCSLETMDFQARNFYEKCGYRVVYTQEGFVNNHVGYLMRKDF